MPEHQNKARHYIEATNRTNESPATLGDIAAMLEHVGIADGAAVVSSGETTTPKGHAAKRAGR